MATKLLLLAALAVVALSSRADAAKDDFDLLIFAQSWPVTTCIEWKERRDDNVCTIPPRVWTIHGIWPTKKGTRGPNFCDRSIRFDSRKATPMQGELEARWTDVHKGGKKFGFWKHEYEKHGSCATSLPQLDTQEEYFEQALEWHREYPLSDILGSAGILPGGRYSWSEIFKAVESELGGKNPSIQCEFDEERRTKTLAQIHICFDKQLRLADCDGISGGLNINCPRKDKFLYPGGASGAVGSVGTSRSGGSRDRSSSSNNSGYRGSQGSRRISSRDDYYDMFIFAQTWPVTNCIEWKERNPDNTCNLPSKIWTVHGLWPTKYGEIGPGFCGGPSFNPSAIKPILRDLEAHWTNVHKNSEEFGFWSHEWEKHGNCAKDNYKLDSEYKYFLMGIELNEEFPLVKYLDAAKIVPGGTYEFDDIFNAIREKIGYKNPAIQCEYDRETKQHTLAQIDICLDKRLDVMDCDRIHGGLNHGCPRSGRRIFYPDTKRVVSESNLWIVFVVIIAVAFILAISFALWKRYRNSSPVSGYQAI